ncbi:nucleoprotein/polynucleotide-associated enzyme [Lysobacteraceae bacterium NML93-0792]|nr:nucleoprotein/polynucleotide-associated enzyme [Xanthomonadaceae bacterium NML93-0792]PBS16249.1 nucleoprotein/polynucleotide-associated enzyme [Xanthomonadaceae bacterium NML93-0793]PBS19059.1 nucleoprotein/polynucleotide-associated enzyme [Xanthomonadaceae bacterium NML93-0831]
MTDSLRDQLLGLGFKAPAKPVPSRDERRPRPNDRNADRRGPRPPGKAGDGRPRPAGGKPGGQARGADRAATPRGAGPQGLSRKPRPPQGDIDLAKAFAIRAQREKDERIEAERLKQEEARLRREARAKLETFMQGKALNRPEADIARHFEYGGKIKRIHVDAEQLAALNAGELGVVQLNGRYLLVTAAVLDEAEAIFPQGVALRVDPAAPAGEDPYSDPRYQVPDDLVW